MLKSRRTKIAVIAVVAALALAGCGSDDKSEGKDSASPTAPADPYKDAPWRMQVVNLMKALRTPEDGKYHAWMSDDPEQWSEHFVYTPLSSGDPGWDKRSNDGIVSVYPGKMNDAEKKRFFAGITRDNSVVADTLTVVDAGGETMTGDNRYKFTFKIRTADGQWLTGMAIGSPGTEADSGRITRLTYDLNQQ
ncbi:hypothetical protein [Streptomyces sp. NPDC059786]|uniref:hypothetical protein n=1 Tax=Streptomyces sp. NPDC059786 TaxID=3346946 RepID=UPI00364E727D